MGTRHLTAVYIDGEYKVAQYGQWDGYPERAGKAILNFARTLADKSRMTDFTNRVRAARWFSEDELRIIDKTIEDRSIPYSVWMDAYPQLDRSLGSEVLDLIMKQEPGIKLYNDLNFAAESLFCEWAWVIDLDAGTFEGYKGFNTERELTPKDRFYSLRDKEDEKSGGYHGVILAAKWQLDDLPTDKDFLAAFSEPEEEEPQESAKADEPTTIHNLHLNVKPIPRLPKMLVELWVRVTPQDIDDIMATALEGGITHWCGSAEVVGDKYLGEYASDQISRDGELRLYDIEDPSENWVLSQQKFLDGLMKYLEAGNLDCIEESNINCSVYDIETGDIDADAADSIIQYALFGELVYG